jgi:preprotein translocase subunit SecY
MGNILVLVTILFMFTAGGMLCMWLGGANDENGSGNGVSILLFAGIVSGMPALVSTMWAYLQKAVAGEFKYWIFVPAVIAIFLILTAFITLIDSSERRIPVQYAKRVVGRKQYGGQSTFLPVKVNMASVLPIIFASALLSVPATIEAFVKVKEGGFGTACFRSSTPEAGATLCCISFLIIAFSYFYVAIQYNPIEMANQLQKNNGGIPGIRPGRPTSDFISRVIGKVTFIGAMFLSIVALLPILLGALFDMNSPLAVRRLSLWSALHSRPPDLWISDDDAPLQGFLE